MKGKDIALLGGAAIVAYYLFKGKAATATDGGGALDTSWLNNLIPQNGVTDALTGVASGVTGGTSGIDIVGALQDMLAKLGLGTPKTDETTPTPVTPVTDTTKAGLPDPTTPQPSNSTSQTGLTLQSGWGDVIKGWLLNTTPKTANVVTTIAAATGGAAIIGGGMAATKMIAPGATIFFKGIGTRLANLMNKGGMGALAILPPAVLSGETLQQGQQKMVSGNFWQGLSLSLFGSEWQGINPIWSGGKAAPSADIAYTLETAKVAFPSNLANYYATMKNLGQRAMKTGEAPDLSNVKAYNTKGYNAGSAQSGNKPLAGVGQAPNIASPAIAAAITNAGGNVVSYNAVMAAWSGVKGF